MQFNVIAILKSLLCSGDKVRIVELEGARLGEFESIEKLNITCPWHGYEYDLESGICRADKRYRLKTFEVVVDGRDLKVRI